MEGQGKSLPVCYVQAQESGDVQRSVEATSLGMEGSCGSIWARIH